MTLSKREELMYCIGYLTCITNYPEKGKNKVKHKNRVELTIEQICRDAGLNDNQIIIFNDEILKQINIVQVVAKATKSLMVKKK